MIWNDNAVRVQMQFGVVDNQFSLSVKDQGDRTIIQSMHGCRESFARHFHLPVFYWSGEPEKTRAAAAFLEQVECRLGLPIKDRIRFRSTTNARIVQVRASRWWMANEARKSLLTAFLRCGMVYDAAQDNFEEALWSQYYTKSTPRATRRFLDGCTVLTSLSMPFCGWVMEFGDNGFWGPLLGLRREHPRLAQMWRWLNDPKARKTTLLVR